MKSQTVRIWDVVFIGPVMIVGAAAIPKDRAPLPEILAALGVATIVYNLKNYIEVGRRNGM